MKAIQPSQILDHDIDNASVWTGSTLTQPDWFISLPVACREEILRWLDFIRQHPLPLLLRHPSQYEMFQCQALMQTIRSMLDQGSRHVVLDGLPLDEMDIDEAKTLGWTVCSMLGRLVPQKWNGTLIYEVRDTGNPYTIGIRASHGCTIQSPHSKLCSVTLPATSPVRRHQPSNQFNNGA
jgi:hypothetical protein